MERELRQILRSLLKAPQSFWQLIREQNAHLARYTKALEKLQRDGLIAEEKGIFTLTAAGRAAAEAQGLIPKVDVVCTACNGRGISFSGIFEKVREEFCKIVTGHRPEALPEFDQGFIEPEIAVARVVFMYHKGDLEGQKILFLGDDDLTSVAALLSGLPQEIAVLDIDDRVLEFVQRAAEEHGWKKLRVYRYDVRDPLPSEFVARFDVFFTDPVETLPGLRIFLSRCAQALRGREAAGYLGLTHLEASRQKWYSIQQMFLDMGLCITDIIPNFHSYELERAGFIKRGYPLVKAVSFHLPAPEINWYTSNLIRLEAAREPRPLLEEGVKIGRELYFDEEAYATLPDPGQ